MISLHWAGLLCGVAVVCVYFSLRHSLSFGDLRPKFCTAAVLYTSDHGRQFFSSLRFDQPQEQPAQTQASAARPPRASRPTTTAA